MFKVSQTQSIHFKQCHVYVVVTRSLERCREHTSYIHHLMNNIHFVLQRVNKKVAGTGHNYVSVVDKYPHVRVRWITETRKDPVCTFADRRINVPLYSKWK